MDYGYSRGGGGYDSRYGEPSFVNPEYYDVPGYGSFGYEPQRTDAIDSSEDPASKRRKLESMTICVDYIRGFCSKGVSCVKAHVSYVESIDEREILAKTKFCHDFQNRGSCDRPSCKFLHVTRREEDEFLLTGTIPDTVFNRAKPPRGGDSMGGGGGGGRYGGPPRRMAGGRMGGRSDMYGMGGGGGGRWGDEPPSYRGMPRNRDRDNHPPATSYGNYCIDYLKGTCNKGRQCSLDHYEVVDDLDHREALVKSVFCHDFQNKRCPRQHCKYLHATFDEQRIFVERGFLSPLVCDRNRNKMFYSDICIDNLRFQCVRGNNCQYKHVGVVSNKDERVYLCRSIFCHDFQESSCPRGSCKLLHTDKETEMYFVDNGYLPEQLKKGPGGNAANYDPAIEAIAETVCRDFVKGVCNRGTSCKYYHPRQEELTRLLAYQKGSKQPGGVSAGMGGSSGVQQMKLAEEKGKVTEELEKCKQENQDLKQRVQQLERLLADACHCITLAVGDQNPTIKTLMDTIAGMAPESALANNNSQAAQNQVKDEP